MIHDLVTAAGKEFAVSYLCDVADVSRSGYYRWLSCAPNRLQREEADYEQHLLIQDIFEKKHSKAGWRVIRMNLERQGIIMNPKKIKRLMKKYGLVTRIRRQNPYKQLAKATQEHRTAPNILQRKFDQATPTRASTTLTPSTSDSWPSMALYSRCQGRETASITLRLNRSLAT
ncbi:MAG TPA: IS3 family transposase [Symbiobacteriaceae bacterium]|nr:IS3 family transposase [Symbiobacteriaceae bacterium]